MLVFLPPKEKLSQLLTSEGFFVMLSSLDDS